MPRKAGPIQKRSIPNVKRVLAVASGKGGVGKSTVAGERYATPFYIGADVHVVNLAFSLAMRSNAQRRLRVGLLDLDIFGPSIPTLMGLQRAEEPRLTSCMCISMVLACVTNLLTTPWAPAGAIIPLTNHGLPTMSMGYLLPRPPASSADSDNSDTPVVWRGLMVQKAVQQLLFDVDWSAAAGADGEGLDILVVDMPPGTGDVPLTLGQLVIVDGQCMFLLTLKLRVDKYCAGQIGAVIVSTPQDVALTDVRRGIAMFRKVDVPVRLLIPLLSTTTSLTTTSYR